MCIRDSFCGSRAIEIMKKQYLGKNGHIAIGTNTLPVSYTHLDVYKRQGFYSAIGLL